MSDTGLNADLVLDIQSALASIGQIEAALDAITQVVLSADTSEITTGIDSAVEAADGTVTAEAETAAVTPAIESAVDAADSAVDVEAETAAVTPAIESAVDAADSDVSVEADTAGVTPAIDSAVDAASATVNVEGDAGGVTSAIDNAVAGANVNVPITADAAALGQVRSELQGLEQAASSTGQNITLSIRTAVQATLGVLSGLFIATGVAYNSLIQRTQAAFTTLLGSTDLARQQLTELEEFASTSPFPRQSFIEATQVLLAFGTAAEDVVPTLGAIQDAVAATGGSADQIGEITFILAQITSTGKITAETLNQLGFRGINAAKLIGDQMGMTEAQIRDSITAGSLDAGEALDALVAGMEENFGGAADNVKETWEGAVDRVKGALRDLSSAIVDPFISKTGGGAAVDFANQLADALRRLEQGIVPVAATLSGSFADVLGAVGNDLMPALVEAFLAAAPAMGSFATLISALAPVISALATVIDAIPAPLLSMAAAAGLFYRVGGPLVSVVTGISSGVQGMVSSFRGAEGGFSASSAGADRMRTALAGINVALVGAAVAFAIYSEGQRRAAEHAANMAAQQSGFRDALTSTEGTIAGVADHLKELVDAGDDLVTSWTFAFDNVNIAESLSEAGLSAEEFAQAIANTDQPLDAMLRSLRDSSDEGAVMALGLKDLEDRLQGEAEAALEAGVITERWTQAQLNAAEAANLNADGSVNSVAALNELNAAALEAEAAMTAQTEALDAQQQALADLATTAPEVALGFEAIAGGADIGVTGLGQFAVAAQEASLSGDALDAMAAQFGTTAPELAAAIEQVAGVITGLRDATLSTLPSLSDIAGAADEFSLGGFRDELQSAYQAILDFNDNLTLIASDGGPRLAAAAATLGPEFAAGIAQGIRDGNPQVVAEAELLLEGIEQAGYDTEGLITGEIGPNLAAATGDMGALASLTFGENFTLDASGRIVLLEDQIEGGVPGVASASATLGAGGKIGFEEGFTPDPAGGIEGATSGITGSVGGFSVAGGLAGGAGKTGFELGFTPSPASGIESARSGISGSAGGLQVAGGTAGTGGKTGFETGFRPNPSPAMDAARALVRQAGPAVQRASGDVGRDAVLGFQAGIGPIGGRARQAAGSIGPAVLSASGAAFAAGRSVGSQLGAGLVAGINSYLGQVRAAAANIASAAAAAARAAAQVSSPSRVWRTIGHQMGEGLEEGLDESRRAVEDAGASLAAAAAASAAAVEIDPFTPGVFDVHGAAFPAAGGGTIVNVTVAPGAVQISGTGDPARDGRVAADALVGAIPGAMQRARFTARVG